MQNSKLFMEHLKSPNSVKFGDRVYTYLTGWVTIVNIVEDVLYYRDGANILSIPENVPVSFIEYEVEFKGVNTERPKQLSSRFETGPFIHGEQYLIVMDKTPYIVGYNLEDSHGEWVFPDGSTESELVGDRAALLSDILYE